MRPHVAGGAASLQEVVPGRHVHIGLGKHLLKPGTLMRGSCASPAPCASLALTAAGPRPEGPEAQRGTARLVQGGVNTWLLS